MPLSISLSAKLESLKMDSTQPWYILLTLTMPDGEILRAANQPDDIVFQGNTYSSCAFLLQPAPQDATGQIPNVTLAVSNVTRMAQPLLEANAGAVGATVLIQVVNASNLAGEPDLAEEYEIQGTQAKNDYIVFTLGAPNPLRMLFPRGFYVVGYCRHKYNTPTMQAALDPTGVLCGYQGAIGLCDHTLNGPNGCRVHSNVPRFGGQQGLTTQGFRTATPI